MLFTLNFQLTLILFNIVSGLFLGLTYDFFKALQVNDEANSFINVLEWVLYYIFITLSYYIAHIYFVKAFISWYTVIVCIFSFVLYMKFLSKYVRNVFIIAMNNISSFFSIVSKYVKFPLYAIKFMIKKIL